MRKWFRDYWQAIPIFAALVLLAIALLCNISNFQNIAWYALVAITAVYAWATMLVVRENKRTVEEMRQSRLDAVKPALSLQPGMFTLDGNFHALYLENSGGVAKGLIITIIINNQTQETKLSMTALNNGKTAYLRDIEIKKHRESGDNLHIIVDYKDIYEQSLKETFSIDFSIEKDRKMIGQHSELHNELHEINRVLGQIERKIRYNK
jgi:hypothetical protein